LKEVFCDHCIFRVNVTASEMIQLFMVCEISAERKNTYYVTCILASVQVASVGSIVQTPQEKQEFVRMC